MKYTVFFDQMNRTNFQVLAPNEEVARRKAVKLFRQQLYVPSVNVQEGWILEEDGEDNRTRR